MTTSLLHYNGCTADVGAPCTCDPPLTTVEDVAAALFKYHEIEFVDAEIGYACWCDEDGYLVLRTEADARKHQADATLTVLRPLIAQQLVESAEIIGEFAQSRPITTAEAQAIFDGIAASLSRPTSEEH